MSAKEFVLIFVPRWPAIDLVGTDEIGEARNTELSPSSAPPYRERKSRTV